MAVERAGPGRTALNLAGVDDGDAPPRHGADRRPGASRPAARSSAWRARCRTGEGPPARSGTAAADATVGRAGRDAIDLPDGGRPAILRLAEPIARRAGRPFRAAPVGRHRPDRRRRGAGRGSAARALAPSPDVERMAGSPRRSSRRRRGRTAARLDLHGVTVGGGAVALAADVAEPRARPALAAVADAPTEASLGAVRAAVARAIRRAATVRRDDAARVPRPSSTRWSVAGRLVRDGDRVRSPAPRRRRAGPGPAGRDGPPRGARWRSPAPPPLAAAARAAGLSAGRGPATSSGRSDRRPRAGPRLRGRHLPRSSRRRALAMAARAPLTPAAFRDATGTSRKYVMAILEDLDRRGILRRTRGRPRPGPAGSTPAPAAR